MPGITSPAIELRRFGSRWMSRSNALDWRRDTASRSTYCGFRLGWQVESLDEWNVELVLLNSHVLAVRGDEQRVEPELRRDLLFAVRPVLVERRDSWQHHGR